MKLTPRSLRYLNSHMPPRHQVRYCALDFSHVSKHRNMNVLKALEVCVPYYY